MWFATLPSQCDSSNSLLRLLLAGRHEIRQHGKLFSVIKLDSRVLEAILLALRRSGERLKLERNMKVFSENCAAQAVVLNPHSPPSDPGLYHVRGITTNANIL